jgi:hypothetical protein
MSSACGSEPIGVIATRLTALKGMTDSNASPQPRDVVDELVEQLLICGGVICQLVTGMVEDAAHGAGVDTASILDDAHELIRNVLGPVTARRPASELEMAAVIVDEVTTEICEELYAPAELSLRHQRSNRETRDGEGYIYGGGDGDGRACRRPWGYQRRPG